MATQSIPLGTYSGNGSFSLQGGSNYGSGRMQGSTNTIQVTSPRTNFQTTYNPQQAGGVFLQGTNAKNYNLRDALKTSDPFAQVMGAIDNQIEKLRAELLAAQNAQPVIPTFDFSGNLARARATAQKTITPIYQQKLDKFLKKQQLSRSATQEQAKLGKEELEKELGFRKGQIGREKTRTQEDTQFTLQNLSQQENLFQQLEGSQFEEERIDAIADVVASGGAISGANRRVLREQVRARNIQSGEQLRQFAQEKFLAERGRDRTLEDLAASEEIETFRKDLGVKRINLELDSFIKNQEIEEQIERLNLGIEERNAVGQETASLERAGIQDFIRTLQANGRPARDIEAFARIAGV